MTVFSVDRFGRLGAVVASVLASFASVSSAQDYTFTFSGTLTEVIDNYGTLSGSGIQVGSPFTGYVTYDPAALPWFTPPWEGNVTYEWIKGYRFTVQTAQGDYEFGYIDSVRAFYQVDVRNYDKLWWGHAGVSGLVARTDFPSQKGTYHVGFNLSNTLGNLWDVAFPLPSVLRASDFDIREVGFHGYDSTNQIEYRIVGEINLEVTTLQHLHSRWYLRSLSMVPPAYEAAAVFPRAMSGPQAYRNGAYVNPDTLVHGEGFWLLYASDDTTLIQAVAPKLEVSTTVDVPPEGGWVLIGTPSVSVPASRVSVSGQATIVANTFFGYTGVDYVHATTLEPWQGYWVLLAAVGGGGQATVQVR